MDKTSSRAIDLSEAAARLSQAQVVESSLFAAAPTNLWESIASVAGVNAELMPAVRVTYPRQYEGLDGEPIVTGRRLFRSVLLLFGVLPIDLHAIALAILTPGRSFLEVLAPQPPLDPRAATRARQRWSASPAAPSGAFRGVIQCKPGQFLPADRECVRERSHRCGKACTPALPWHP